MSSPLGVLLNSIEKLCSAAALLHLALHKSGFAGGEISKRGVTGGIAGPRSLLPDSDSQNEGFRKEEVVPGVVERSCASSPQLQQTEFLDCCVLPLCGDCGLRRRLRQGSSA